MDNLFQEFKQVFLEAKRNPRYEIQIACDTLISLTTGNINHVYENVCFLDFEKIINHSESLSEFELIINLLSDIINSNQNEIVALCTTNDINKIREEIQLELQEKEVDREYIRQLRLLALENKKLYKSLYYYFR